MEDSFVVPVPKASTYYVGQAQIIRLLDIDMRNVSESINMNCLENIKINMVYFSDATLDLIRADKALE